MKVKYVKEPFTAEERALLAPHFTNLEGPVFALTNLPEVVKGALFARYSRTRKSLRRLFLDEFAEDVGPTGELTRVGETRAERLYERVFVEFGDDSVAQLGGVHLACEQASQLLCKALEWGRLGAYLEQSTRYMRYDDKPGGRWRATIPPEVHKDLRREFERFHNLAFGTYGNLFGPLVAHYETKFSRPASEHESIYDATVQAKTCDTLRGLLPATTRSNLGIYATGQSYEQLVMRLAAHPSQEMRDYGGLILTELRKVIPVFLKRVDQPDRGVAWTEYLARTRRATRLAAEGLVGDPSVTSSDEVVLSDFDPEGETKTVAAALYSSTHLSDLELQSIAQRMTAEEREQILRTYVGERGNRRHKPGRAFERTQYRFDILCDFGAFRDLQRHRLLTIEWQDLSPIHGYETPQDVIDAGLGEKYEAVMVESSRMYERLVDAGLDEVAQYAVSMAHKIRFFMQMNAREAMHLIELRSGPQGHPAYRKVAQEMYRLIEKAGHQAIANAMRFVDDSEGELERREAERRAAGRRFKNAQQDPLPFE